MADFLNLAFDVLDTELKAAINAALLDVAETRDFVEFDDFWKEGQYWIGLQPNPEDANAMEAFELLKVGFTPKNECRPCVERPKKAVLGNEPDWDIVFNGSAKEAKLKALPSKDETANAQAPTTRQILGIKTPTKPQRTNPFTDNADQKSRDKFDLMDAANVDWWTEAKALEALKTFLFHLIAYGKGTLRIYLPSGRLKKYGGRLTKNKTIAVGKMKYDAALKCIFVEAPEYERGGVFVDDDTMDNYSILEVPAPRAIGEKNETKNQDRLLEVSFLNDKNLTEVFQISNQPIEDGSEKTTQIKQRPLDLKGNLLVYQAEFPALITKSVRANQKQLNFAKTMQGHLVGEYGFPETDILNANLPKVKDTNETDWAQLPRGMGSFRNLVGTMYQDAQGGQHITNPEVIRHQPTETKIQRELKQDASNDILEMCHQLWVKMADDATASGESRIQALVDFILLLIELKAIVDAAGLWLLQTVTRTALNLTGEVNLLDKFDVIFDSKVFVGKISADERRLMLDEIKEKVRSIRSYQIACEITDDPDAENRVIDEEQTKIQSRLFEAQVNMSKINMGEIPKSDKEEKEKGDKE